MEVAFPRYTTTELLKTGGAMRSRRVAAVTALLISAGSITALPAAFAADGTTLYVNNRATACTDKGATAGSAATPYCTIQAAADAVTAGQTIMIEAGLYAPFSISASGTAAAPITITGASGSAFKSPAPSVNGSGAVPAITVSGASYVQVKGLWAVAGTGSAVVFTGSSHVSLDSSEVISGLAGTAPVVYATSGSSAVTISRNLVNVHRKGVSIEADGGGSGDVITTNHLSFNTGGPGIVVDGVPGTAVTSNSLQRD